jgi:hypothetical protein
MQAMQRCPQCATGDIVITRGWATRQPTSTTVSDAQAKPDARICDIAQCTASCGFKQYGHVLGTVYDERYGHLTEGRFEQDHTLGESTPAARSVVRPIPVQGPRGQGGSGCRESPAARR